MNDYKPRWEVYGRSHDQTNDYMALQGQGTRNDLLSVISRLPNGTVYVVLTEGARDDHELRCAIDGAKPYIKDLHDWELYTLTKKDVINAFIEKVGAKPERFSPMGIYEDKSGIMNLRTIGCSCCSTEIGSEVRGELGLGYDEWQSMFDEMTMEEQEEIFVAWIVAVIEDHGDYVTQQVIDELMGVERKLALEDKDLMKFRDECEHSVIEHENGNWRKGTCLQCGKQIEFKEIKDGKEQG